MIDFGPASKAKLATCHPDLQRLFNRVNALWPCTIQYGQRTPEEQAELVKSGASKTLNSKHVNTPALAADVTPDPLDWKDTARFYYFGGFVCGLAESMGIPIRWGGDWDGDMQVKDQNFNDLVHFELIDGGGK
jgi:hypothetical protein